MRPVVRFLDEDLINAIIGEARNVLAVLGVEIREARVRRLLAEHGAELDGETSRVRFDTAVVDRALGAVPQEVVLFDAAGEDAITYGGLNVHFTPGSSAVLIDDPQRGEARAPTTGDYVRYARLVGKLDHIAAQSTAFAPCDVPEQTSDSARLWLSLVHCRKPVVTGAFSAEGLEVMKDLLLAVRGSEEALRDRPLAIFSCCPTSPLKWSDTSLRHLTRCAELGIPAEIVSMPLAGLTAPVTLAGTLTQHTSEVLSGVVISQLLHPGAPLLWGGSQAIFDVREETTPLGAAESMMLACASSEIGKRLNLPTQAYMALSDAKVPDAQAGAEASMGATLAALSGINSVAGPGMLDFQRSFSLEALVVDDAICGAALRLVDPIEPKDDFPAIDRLGELLADGHLLISEHTRTHRAGEHRAAPPVIDRLSRSKWAEQGGTSAADRAREEVIRLTGDGGPSHLDDDVRAALADRMGREFHRHGLQELPEID